MVSLFICFVLGSMVSVSAAFQETACANAGGNCMSTSGSCDGHFLTGYCPTQSANIKCCVKSGDEGGVHQETPCYNAGGNCMSTSGNCNGHFLTGKCPTQSANIKCCVKDISDGNGVHQETACANAGGNCMSTSSKCGGSFLSGYCPTQSANIKCCVSTPDHSDASAKKVLDLAASQVGYHEGDNNYNKYATEVHLVQYAYWCDIFVSWCFYKAGQQVPPGVISAGVVESKNAWKAANRFSKYPAVGAQVIFGAEGSTHTGLVYKYDTDTIYTIEGNCHDTVCRTTHSRGDPYVYGYGYPLYSHLIVSADPHMGNVQYKAQASV